MKRSISILLLVLGFTADLQCYLTDGYTPPPTPTHSDSHTATTFRNKLSIPMEYRYVRWRSHGDRTEVRRKRVIQPGKKATITFLAQRGIVVQALHERTAKAARERD